MTHDDRREAGRMQVVIAGASGFLGRHLTEHLARRGHEVVGLTRGSAGPGESTWNPAVGQVDRSLVQGADVVVNLAGTSIAGNPHSRRWQREVMDSRLSTTGLLARTVAEADRAPAFIAGGGISFYGDQGSTPLTEESPSVGDALLTRVARAWEAAADPARQAGARVAVLRTAPVLDRTSSPLRQLRLLFSLGLGARISTGEQFFPVMSLRDWVAAAGFLIESAHLQGPFNMCCPQTPTNAEFTDALARAVRRPHFLVAPAPVLRAAAGPMAPELLGSLNAQPQALERAGFDFEDEGVSEVLAAALA
jgi:uncharacterized protein (TIGR01777 family)